MSSDNQYTALGPAAIGFQTDGTNITVGAQIAGTTIGAQITGKTVGIKGICEGAGGDGVQGNGTGSFSGLAGWGGSNSGTGVIGFGGGGNGPGVRGIGSGATNSSPAGPVGVYGHGGAGAPGIIGAAGTGTADGVQGFGTGNFSGVAGFGGPNAGTGVFGIGGTFQGTGATVMGPGVRGIGGGGQNTVPQGANGLIIPVGVYGHGAQGADGVYGVAGPGSSAAQSFGGVHGVGGAGSPDPDAPASYAGLFDGAVLINGPLTVKGTVTKAGGSFQIDHPLDPANKYLVHSFVESPDMKNVYDGEVIVDSSGVGEIQLPGYFEALNKDFRYQLTPIGAPAPDLHVRAELRDNRFAIAGAAPGQRVCWQVTGTRKDAWALANPVVVERDKPKLQRGWRGDADAGEMLCR